jgi:hypothetical protein
MNSFIAAERRKWFLILILLLPPVPTKPNLLPLQPYFLCVCDESQLVSRKIYHFPKYGVCLKAEKQKKSSKVITIITIYEVNQNRVL